MLEQLPVALMRVDDAGTLLAVNDAGLALLGTDSLDRVLGTSFLSFLTDEAARADCAAFLHDAAHGLRGSREMRLRGVSGHEHIVEAHAIAYPGAPDQTPSVTVTLRDVSRTHALTRSLIEASERQSELELASATERERWIADRSELDAVLGRSQNLERERDEARTVVADWEARHDALERAHEVERAERAELARVLDHERESADGRLAEIAAAHERQIAEQAASHAARVTALESDLAGARQDATQLRTALDAAQAAARDADVALASARAAADEARAALSATEAALAEDRDRAAADIAAARDEARRAREAWSDHEAVRREAEQRRQFVEHAVARLAVEIGLIAGETGTGIDDRTGDDGEARSAW